MLSRLIPTLVALMLVTPHASAQTFDPAGDARRITVTGMADAALAPDRATLRVGVVAEGRTAADAVARMGRDAAALFETLDSAGIPASDIRTSRIDLREMRDPNARPEPGRAPRIVGFVADTQIAVVLSDLERLGVLLDTLVRAGANRIDGVVFGLADPESVLATLRAEAVRDAMDRAAAYAAAAGVTLGPVMTITDRTDDGPAPMSRMLAADAGVPVAPGSLTLSDRVTMTFAIRD